MIELSYNTAPIFIIPLRYNLRIRDVLHSIIFFVISPGGIIRGDHLHVTKSSITDEIVAPTLLLAHEHVLVVKLLHGLVLLLTKSCYTEISLQDQSIRNAIETLPPVAETIYYAQHVLLPYFFFWKSRDGIHML